MVSDDEFSSNSNDDLNNEDLEIVMYVQKGNKRIRLMHAELNERSLTATDDL